MRSDAVAKFNLADGSALCQDNPHNFTDHENMVFLRFPGEVGSSLPIALEIELFRRPGSSGPSESLLKVLKRLKLKILDPPSLLAAGVRPANGPTCVL